MDNLQILDFVASRQSKLHGLERFQSGRSGRIVNPLYLQGYPGFIAPKIT